MKNNVHLKIKLSLFFLLSISFSGISQSSFEIEKMEKLTEIPFGFNAIFTPKAEKIVYSNQENVGLAVFDIKTKQVKNLNSDAGAGFEPSISSDGSIIFYKSYQFDENGKRFSSIIAQNIKSSVKTSIIENQRELSSVFASQQNAAFLVNSEVKIYNSKQKKVKSCTETLAFTDSNMDLVLCVAGKTKIVNPLGKQNYIWVSLSPDKTKILFNQGGKGAYIADLNGNILTKLGKINAAKWSYDGKWIVGMNDTDDGQEYVSSSIVIASVNGKEVKNLELKNQKIALFPALSSDNSQLVFNNEKGEIFILSFKR